jgi:hypothetical protein
MPRIRVEYIPFTVAALFVETRGPYVNLDGIDPWDKERDARKYEGPWPVIAHPPCERWGRYAKGGPSVKIPRKIGDDEGCFASALESVRRFGGVLEHPADSHAWKWFGLQKPDPKGGWYVADEFGGFSCRVDQGNYGHRARKATWLYACKTELPELNWKRAKSTVKLDAGYHSKEERQRAKETGTVRVARMGTREQKLTPVPFRDLLISIARSCTSS